MVIKPYSWRFSMGAYGEFSKLPKEIQVRVIGKLEKSKYTPFKYFIRLKGRKDYKLRLGDYRVIVDIDRRELSINITKLGHRKNIYKK